MTQVIDEPVKSPSPNGKLLLLFGSLIGLASAAGLAWDGTLCGDVLYEVLTALNPSGIFTTGQRLVWTGRCPLGVALGGTLVSFGLRRAAWKSGLSRACMALVALYGLLAALGAFAVCQGASNLQASFSLVAASGQTVKPEQLAQATTEAAMLLSRGWILLSVAHVALLVGVVAQIVLQPMSASPAQWPSTAIAALIPLWLFGAIVSTAWIRSGLAFQQFAASPVVNASEVVANISGVLWSGVVGSWLLMGYALLTMIHAVIAAISAFQRSSSSSSHGGH